VAVFRKSRRFRSSLLIVRSLNGSGGIVPIEEEEINPRLR